MALTNWNDIIQQADKLRTAINGLQTDSDKLFKAWSKGGATISDLQIGMEKIAQTNSILTQKEKEYNEVKKKSIQLQKQAEKEADKISRGLDKERQLSEELIRVKMRQVKEEAKLEAEKKRIIELQKKESKSDKELIELNSKLIRVRANLTKNTKENRQEYARLTAEIVRNEKAIRSSDAQIGRFQRNVGNYAGAFKSFGASLGLVGGAFILANGIKSSIAKIKDFEKAISNLRAITGASGKDLEYLKNQALKLAASTGNSAVDIVEAFKLVASAKPELLSNVEALNKTTEAVITLSQASGMDLQESTVALTSIMNQFGAGADEATKYINVLGAGAKFGSGEIDFLSEAMVKAGSVSKSAGLSVETLTAAMELFAEKGVKAEIAGTGFKSILVKMQSDMKNYTNGQFDLNKAIQNYQGIATNNVELVKTFGKEYFNLAGILLTNKDRFYELEKQVTGTNTAIEQAAINMDNLSGDLEKAGGAWDAFVLSIESDSGVITQTLRGIVQLFSELLTELIELNKYGTITNKTVREQTSTNIEAFKEEIKLVSEAMKLRRIQGYIAKLNTDLYREENAENPYSSNIFGSQYKNYLKWEETHKNSIDIIKRELIELKNLSGDKAFLTGVTEENNKVTEEENKNRKEGNKLIKKEIELRKELQGIDAGEKVGVFGKGGERLNNILPPEAVENIDKQFKAAEDEIGKRYTKLQSYLKNLMSGKGSFISQLFGGGENGEQAARALNEVWSEFAQVYNQYLQQQVEKYDEMINKSEERIDSIQAELDAEIDRIDEVKKAGQAYDLSKKKALEDQLKAEQKYLDASTNEQRKAKQRQKRMAIAEANINIASAILQVWNQAGIWWVKLAQSIAMGAIGAVQLNNIRTQQFAEGTEYLTRGNNPAGRDTIPIMADEGERILSKKQNSLIPKWFSNDLVPEAVNYFINSKGQVVVKEDKKALKHLEGIERNTAKNQIYNEKGKLIKEIKGNHIIYYN